MSRTILVTGANSEIGAELCRLALVSGYKVLALYHRRKNRIEDLKKDSLLHLIKIDFSSTDGIEKFISKNTSLLNEVDVFVNLAAIRNPVRYEDIVSSDLISHFIVNVLPAVLLTQYLGESMARKGWGRIVIGSSIGVKFGGGDDSFCYSITKYASELIPKAAKRWAESGVLTNVVRIGVTNTETFRSIGKDKIQERIKLVPMKRLAFPEEIAGSIFWIASEQNTFITGQSIPISGGE